jgi:DNA-binding IclR family transcriptional regulator
VSLVRTRLVETGARAGTYDLGSGALEMGLEALARLDIVEIAGARLKALAEETGETVLLSVWGNRGPVIIRMLETGQPVTVNVRVGSVLPLLRSATGRVFLTWLPAVQVEAVLAFERDRDGPAPEQLKASVRRYGLARVDGDLLPGVAALAAPVFAHDGSIAAAITVLGPEGRIDIGWGSEVAGALRWTGSELSARLGYREERIATG